ncbi:MAG: C39 family peptidase [Gemmatimonadota bacterium]
MRASARSVAVGAGLVAVLGGASAQAQSLPARAPVRTALDVPYLPQSELLCGGAAVAMVERWWGRRGVYAEDFSDLVRPDLGGILTSELAAAARRRGWETVVFDGTPEQVRRDLETGAPVVTLIQVAPDRYHYVVVLGWSNGRVVFHDPARSPSMTVDETRFLDEWTRADRWAMVLRPAAPAPIAITRRPDPPAAPDSMPCRPWLDRALDAAAANRLDAAADLLAQAQRACPTEALILREMAGIRFKQGRLGEAVALAAEYVERAPNDARGWQLLAATRYLAGDPDGALEAWNRVGRPTVDLVRIDGTRGVRFGQIAGAMSVPHGTVLTASRLALARRRVADLPALSGSAVEYRPVAGGIVEVRAVVAERPPLEQAPRLLAIAAIRALARNEVDLEVATPTGAGELWSAMWRWEHARPRTALRLDLPAELGFHGIVTVEGARERFRFALDTARSGALEETRRSAVAAFGGWITPNFRPTAGFRFEQWSGARQYLAGTAGAELRAADSRFALTITGEYAAALAAHPSYERGGVRATWASSTGLGQAAWSARLGADLASPAAPLGTVPMVGGNLSWVIPLRAHPETAGGRLDGRSAGRVIGHGGLTADHPIHRMGPVTLAAGVFLDGAGVGSPADGSGTGRFYLDAGAGLRAGIADGRLGVLRIDLATGVLDRRTALTVGIHRSWPPFGERSR